MPPVAVAAVQCIRVALSSLPASGLTMVCCVCDVNWFRCSSWTKRLITAKDHAAVQINIGNVDPATGTYTGDYQTFALCGFVRTKVRGVCCSEALVFGRPDVVDVLLIMYSVARVLHRVRPTWPCPRSWPSRPRTEVCDLQRRQMQCGRACFRVME